MYGKDRQKNGKACIYVIYICMVLPRESRKERTADALAHGGDEGRDKLR